MEVKSEQYIKEAAIRVLRQFNGKKIVFSTNDTGTTNCISTCKRVKLDSYITSYTTLTQNRSKTWTDELNCNLLEESIGVNLHDLRVSNSFLDMIPKVKETKE